MNSLETGPNRAYGASYLAGGRCGGAGPEPLEPAELPAPQPGRGEVLVRVTARGVCHTELDEMEARSAPPGLPVVPGHEVVGRVEQLGDGATQG